MCKRPNVLQPVTLCLVVSVILSLFFSCTTAKPSGRTEDPLATWLTDSVVYRLQDPSCLTEAVSEVQKIEGRYGPRSFSFLSVTEILDSSVMVLILNEMGIEIGSVSFDGAAVESSGFFISRELPAQYLVADIQFVYYRSECLEAALSPLGIHILEEPSAEGSRFRDFYSGENRIIHIEYSDSGIEYYNELRGYSYRLQPEGTL